MLRSRSSTCSQRPSCEVMDEVKLKHASEAAPNTLTLNKAGRLLRTSTRPTLNLRLLLLLPASV